MNENQINVACDMALADEQCFQNFRLKNRMEKNTLGKHRLGGRII